MPTKCLFVIAILFIMGSTKSEAQIEEIRAINALSVNIKLLTTFSISCEAFDKSLKNQIKSRIITDKDSISALAGFISKPKYSKSNKNVDVRIKLICDKSNGEKIEVCTDGRKLILVNGRLIKENKKFLTFIKALVGQ